MSFTKAQITVLTEANCTFAHISEKGMCDIVVDKSQILVLGNGALIELLTVLNALYRGGEPLVTDAEYDFIFLAELQQREPNHPFLHTVESEPVADSKTVELPVRMLSTEKAYEFSSIERWGKRIEKAAEECGVSFDALVFKATPKLDGYAAFDDGQTLYTRGDGRRGTDITRAFRRGLQVAGTGKRGLGAGEIVVSRSYFKEFLADYFDNSRNFQASLIKEKELESPAAGAIKNGKAVFFPFSLLPEWRGNWRELLADFDTIIDDLWQKLDYDIDGIVLEVTDVIIKKRMGATRHHHRWQIAFKKITETADVKVVQVVPQTSRSGRVNPVAEVEPTRLSGALIKRASVHHYNMVREKGVGPGALIRLSRSGEVIPKIEAVLVPVSPEIPESCPSCGSALIWENDYLICVNTMNCTAQITHSIEHFFKTLGNIDGFGPASIRKMFDACIRSVGDIYSLAADDFVQMGFGPKQADNMVSQLQRSIHEPIEDWRFLAAFGVYRMGLGNCEKLLEVFPLEKVFRLTIEEIITVKGFSDKSAVGMLTGLQFVMASFNALFGLGFNLIITPVSVVVAVGKEKLLSGKILVFSGSMLSGSRDEMKREARLHGARTGNSITGKTDMLICGAKVGEAKRNKAEKLGVRIISEKEYRLLIG